MKRKIIVSAEDLSGLKFYQYVTPANKIKDFDVIIIGGSYAGLSAAIVLGRALKQVLIIDSGHPCNSQSLYAHNFITQDGEMPSTIAAKAKEQVLKYRNLKFIRDKVKKVQKDKEKFFVETNRSERFSAKKILFATGVKDIMPEIPGFKECWGISILNCPNCHAYEISNTRIGIFANGELAYEIVKVISNWSKRLTVFTNGKSRLTQQQKIKIEEKNIPLIDQEIISFDHKEGRVKNIISRNNNSYHIDAIFTQVPFMAATEIPERDLGCKMNDNGLIQIDLFQRTTVYGIYAAGDNSSAERSISVATASGATAGTCINNEITEEQF